MSSVWDKQYKELLKDLPQDSWVPWIKGNIGDQSVEISIVHTSYPHGLLSWGWSGEYKLVLFVGERHDETRRAKRAKLHTQMMKVATVMAATFNISFPEGII